MIAASQCIAMPDVVGSMSWPSYADSGCSQDVGAAHPPPRDPEKERLRFEAEASQRQRRIAATLDIWSESYSANEKTQEKPDTATKSAALAWVGVVIVIGRHWHH
jgi:hypothetical protein